MKILAFCLLPMTMFLISCGTDVQPNYFIGMFRDEGDIDRLSKCLSEMPQVDGDTITIKSDRQCLVDLSKHDTSDPNMDVTFSEILNDPESFMDKLLTFDAIVKETRTNGHYIWLYTNRHDMSFEITSHGANVFHLDEDGEEVDILPNHKYQFRCRITKIQIDVHRVWYIYADLIITSDKKVVYQPKPVE